MAEPVRSARRRRRSSSASPPPAPRRRRGLFDLSDAPPFQLPVRARRGPARVLTGPSMPSVILDFSVAPPAASVPSGDASMEPPPTVAASVPSATASLDVPMGLVSPRQEGRVFSASASPALLLRRRRGLENVSSLPISTGAGSSVPSPGLRHALPSPGRQRAGRPSSQARDSSRGSGRRGSGSSGRARGHGRYALDRRAVVVCSSPLPSPAAHVPSDRPAPVPISLEEDARRREIRLGKRPVDNAPAPVHVCNRDESYGAALPFLTASSSNPVPYVDSSDDEAPAVWPNVEPGVFVSPHLDSNVVSPLDGPSSWAPFPHAHSSAVSCPGFEDGTSSSLPVDDSSVEASTEPHVQADVPLVPLGAFLDYLPRVPPTPLVHASRARLNRRTRLFTRRRKVFVRQGFRLGRLQLPLPAD